ncbi:MAG: lipopolysaccharide heptosyltransferase I [Gammaproteobacteria bacterium]|nr:lipopolysaccharide heptosyltransferase I [Gammaproteobacteria bacterium]
MKVLVVKLSSMGDVISALPALTDAKKAIAGISFDWVVEENFSEIPTWHPAVEKVIPIALRRWRKQVFNRITMREIAGFWKKIRAQHYDYVLDVQGLIKSAIVSKVAHGVSYGFSTSSAREPLATYLYQNKVDIAKKLHTTERARQLFASALGYTFSPGHPDYGITNIKVHGDNDSLNGYLFFAHGASRNNKCWRVENWIDLALLAKDSGLKVKLPWGNEQEFKRANLIAVASDNVEVLPKLTLTEIVEVLLGAKGVIAVDTGFGHLAAALSVPAVSLYGPTDPTLGGAYGDNHRNLIDMETLNAQLVWQKMRSEFNI